LVIIRRVRAIQAFLGLGSNESGGEGSPRRQLERALARMSDFGLVVDDRSSFYRTEPVGGPPQPWFVNAVAAVTFRGSPFDLLQACLSIESLHGRRRTVANGPRTLDVDILLIGDTLLDAPELSVPHPRLAERRFVLVPMVEIAASVRDPRSGLTMRELLERCTDESVVVPLSEREPAAAEPGR
jgi:2-amino-4-hydroxy-6-hydroxymethyldihydropteridine diphosphokinase